MACEEKTTSFGLVYSSADTGADNAQDISSGVSTVGDRVNWGAVATFLEPVFSRLSKEPQQLSVGNAVFDARLFSGAARTTDAGRLADIVTGLSQAADLSLVAFDFNQKAAHAWMTTPNDYFFSASPAEYCLVGRASAVTEFILERTAT